jgi:hypothetical protein
MCGEADFLHRSFTCVFIKVKNGNSRKEDFSGAVGEGEKG